MLYVLLRFYFVVISDTWIQPSITLIVNEKKLSISMMIDQTLDLKTKQKITKNEYLRLK